MLIRSLRFLMLVALVMKSDIGLPDPVDTTIFVTGRLVTLKQEPACGALLIGSLASYEVSVGPINLVGKLIQVVIPCAELPRADFSPEAGDLESFEVGAMHFLALSRSPPPEFGLPSSFASAGSWYYVVAASLRQLRPNYALERSVTGLAVGAAGAWESLAPAAPTTGVPRPAQRGR
jgi:hypothetical protein